MDFRVGRVRIAFIFRRTAVSGILGNFAKEHSARFGAQAIAERDKFWAPLLNQQAEKPRSRRIAGNPSPRGIPQVDLAQ